MDAHSAPHPERRVVAVVVERPDQQCTVLWVAPPPVTPGTELWRTRFQAMNAVESVTAPCLWSEANPGTWVGREWS